MNISDKPQTFSKCCMNDNCQLTIKEYLCHFDLLPFHGRRPNLMLLLSSCADTHPAAPFFVTVVKRVTSFYSFVPRQFSSDNMKFCSLSEQIFLFNPVLEMSLNSQLNERYDVSKFGLFSSAKFTRKMWVKLFISYAAVFGIQFSFELYSWYVSITFVTVGPLV